MLETWPAPGDSQDDASRVAMVPMSAEEGIDTHLGGKAVAAPYADRIPSPTGGAQASSAGKRWLGKWDVAGSWAVGSAAEALATAMDHNVHCTVEGQGRMAVEVPQGRWRATEAAESSGAAVPDAVGSAPAVIAVGQVGRWTQGREVIGRMARRAGGYATGPAEDGLEGSAQVGIGVGPAVRWIFRQDRRAYIGLNWG